MMIEHSKIIDGAFVIIGDRYEDKRGFFEERWNFDQLMFHGIGINFKQSNISTSIKGTLRGMHVQSSRPQGKLISVLAGQIYDVIVDIRPESPTYKKWLAIKLNSKVNLSLYAPPGCAHGFFVQSDMAIVQYLCTTTYDKSSDGGIVWNDPEIDVVWPFDSDFLPLVSQKDSDLPPLSQYLEPR